jgi:hypothetical protein
MTAAPKGARPPPDAWRLGNAGRVLGNAVTRFDLRVLELMATAGHVDPAGTPSPSWHAAPA